MIRAILALLLAIFLVVFAVVAVATAARFAEGEVPFMHGAQLGLLVLLFGGLSALTWSTLRRRG